MKLVCPSCGATASADAWLNDTECRLMLAEVVKLPAPLPPSVICYLSLFRSENRALGWKKALRLVREIKELTATGYVRFKGLPDRDCSPAIWAKAMDIMVEGRQHLTLPMPNHNYLRKVAHDLAADAAKQAEKNRRIYRPAATSLAEQRKPQPAAPQEARSEEDTQYGLEQIAKIMSKLKGV